MKFLKAFLLILAIASILLSSTLAFENKLVGYWPFDEGKGSPKDASGNENHGKIAGEPRWVDGKFGKALEFDGKDDHIVVKDHPTLDFTKNLTIMAWFMPKEVMTKRRMMSKTIRFLSCSILVIQIRLTFWLNQITILSNPKPQTGKLINGTILLEPMMGNPFVSMLMGNWRAKRNMERV